MEMKARRVEQPNTSVFSNKRNSLAQEAVGYITMLDLLAILIVAKVKLELFLEVCV